MSFMQQCLGFKSGAYVADFLFGCVSSFWYWGGYLVSAVHALLVGLGERVASWLVGAGSERQKKEKKRKNYAGSESHSPY